MRKEFINKMIVMCLVLCICASITGCQSRKNRDNPKVADNSNVVKFSDGIIGENKSGAEDGAAVGILEDGLKKNKEKSITYGREYDAVCEEADASDDYIETNGLPNIAAGTLTGGEVRDLKNWDNWLHSYDENVADLWHLNPKNRISVYVHNADAPVNNVTVRLMSGDKVIYESKTTVDGYAYLFYAYDSKQDYKPDTIQVEKKDGSFENYGIDKVNSKNELEVESDIDNKDIKLDLMF
ncbi:MAG: hypothetical protein IKN54_00510, partial [Lachnospiraceae bacterium]|nr:hypothetical protein [Lachnospiraceae bacterium]